MIWLFIEHNINSIVPHGLQQCRECKDFLKPIPSVNCQASKPVNFIQLPNGPQCSQADAWWPAPGRQQRSDAGNAVGALGTQACGHGTLGPSLGADCPGLPGGWGCFRSNVAHQPGPPDLFHGQCAVGTLGGKGDLCACRLLLLWPAHLLGATGNPKISCSYLP